jgi:hypothetical protein
MDDQIKRWMNLVMNLVIRVFTSDSAEEEGEAWGARSSLESLRLNIILSIY